MNLLQKASIKAIKSYQKYISPDHSIWAKAKNNPPYCRHIPSCSDYTKEAIIKKWFFLWWFKWFLRILRCMPWNKGWYDPVEKEKK